MNPKITAKGHPWHRLTTAARNVSDDRDTRASYGFATRIAALAFSQEERLVSLFDRFALRALGVASLLALGSFAINYQELKTAPSAPVVLAASLSPADVMLADSDTVAVIFDLAD